MIRSIFTLFLYEDAGIGSADSAFIVGVVWLFDVIYRHKKALASPCRQTTPETDETVELLGLEKASALIRM